MLEVNGSPTGYDVGTVPGLPYKVVRPESRLQRSQLNPNPPRGIVLGGCRIADLETFDLARQSYLSSVHHN
jgi:hypothetical protein